MILAVAAHIDKEMSTGDQVDVLIAVAYCSWLI